MSRIKRVIKARKRELQESTKSAVPNATGRSKKIRPKKRSMDLATRKSVVTSTRGVLVEWRRKQKPNCSQVRSEWEVRNQ